MSKNHAHHVGSSGLGIIGSTVAAAVRNRVSRSLSGIVAPKRSQLPRLARRVADNCDLIQIFVAEQPLLCSPGASARCRPARPETLRALQTRTVCRIQRWLSGRLITYLGAGGAFRLYAPFDRAARGRREGSARYLHWVERRAFNSLGNRFEGQLGKAIVRIANGPGVHDEAVLICLVAASV